MAVVRDDKGRAVGMITVKDLVEEVVGELAEW
jgi:CBS domain containing-hemolysin-like protein